MAECRPQVTSGLETLETEQGKPRMEARPAGGAQDPPVGTAGEGQLSAPSGPLGQLACPALPSCPPSSQPSAHS